MSELKISDFLSTGKLIRTKHCDSLSWVTNIVYSVNEEYIEMDIGMEKKYIDGIIMVGDTIKCKYTTDEYEYYLLGWIMKIKADFPQSITVRIHSVDRFENKRDSYRFDVYLCAVIRLNSSINEGIFAVMINLSSSGAAFVVHNDSDEFIQFSEAEEVEAAFEVYISPQKRLVFEGVFVRKLLKEKGIEYGIKFTRIDNENAEILRDLLIELENKDAEFYNSRKGYWLQNSKYSNKKTEEK